MNCSKLWKLGASRFNVQLASLEIDLNVYRVARKLKVTSTRLVKITRVLPVCVISGTVLSAMSLMHSQYIHVRLLI